jgi:hypothetical protein
LLVQYYFQSQLLMDGESGLVGGIRAARWEDGTRPAIAALPSGSFAWLSTLALSASRMAPPAVSRFGMPQQCRESRESMGPRTAGKGYLGTGEP